MDLLGGGVEPAQAILVLRPKFPDADRYRELEVEFFARCALHP